ncbi:flavin-containing monooxygenase [Phenylobacterium sp.]|uniref:flavin-containing monooxygenase n=1 Tax=Phenylobacterium sp. TaxID=1871053 RepID=UPI00374D6F2D
MADGSKPQASDHFDVLIVGAGLSGIGAGWHLQDKAPGRSYVILEGREAIGGTWDLFRYPGIRSDSDMYTLGYAFKPWTEAKAIADGPSILKYVRETAADYGIDQHIRYGHKVTSAAWSTQDACWTVTAARGDGAVVQLTASFIFLCGGYYSYDGGYTPDFPGAAAFQGDLVHPQQWPETLDYAGKRVVVIGSGATAVTLVPAMAATAAHVTMLQRSPTYVVSRPAEDAMANRLRRWLPAMLAYNLIRWRNVLFGMWFFRLARNKPDAVKQNIIAMVRQALGPDYDVGKHFTPRYNPWDQRLCLVPDSDLFEALKAGKAEVVTDHIETFTPTGIRLTSGAELAADVIVSATGLVLQVMNGLAITIDGVAVDPGQTLSYKGMMYEGVPNLASAFGYTNASWTLKCDLTCEYVCRLLNHMKATGLRQVTPHNDDPDIERQPWLDFSSGYVTRAMEKFPKQGATAPWKLHQNYALDLMSLRYARLEDGALAFSNPKPATVKARESVAA